MSTMVSQVVFAHVLMFACNVFEIQSHSLTNLETVKLRMDLVESEFTALPLSMTPPRQSLVPRKLVPLVGIPSKVSSSDICCTLLSVWY